MSKEEADEAVSILLLDFILNKISKTEQNQEKARREDQVRVELAIKESLKENTTPQSGFMADAKTASAAPPPAPTSNIDDLLSLGEREI